MANIPGISGYVQPGVFARDRVVSRGVSIPGGLRIPCIMGEGLREETIVEAAAGGGRDGNPDASPDGDPLGKYFSLQYAPIISGRTELFLNGSALRGVEGVVDGSSFDGMFDFKIDTDTGYIQMQGASLEDQDGKKYSASTLNKGNGIIVDEDVGDTSKVQILDSNAPEEIWTIKVASVRRGPTGLPVSGGAVFTATGSVSGQIKDSSGSPYLFHDTYVEKNSTGTIPGSLNIDGEGTDAYPLIKSINDGAGFDKGYADYSAKNASGFTNKFILRGDVLATKQVLIGDYLTIDDFTYDPTPGVNELIPKSSHKIIDLVLDGTDTIVYVNGYTIDARIGNNTTGVPLSLASRAVWQLRAIDILLNNESTQNPVTGEPTSGVGPFKLSDVGKVVMFTNFAVSGIDIGQLYRIKTVTSSARVRLTKFDESLPVFPALNGVLGIADNTVSYCILETNGILLFGIEPGSKTFDVGDKFFINVKSRILKKNDRLEAKYIAESDINDPELFLSSVELAKKHGQESLTNTLSLGARLCFENQAPFVLAVQCKPPVPRRTSSILIREISAGVGGFNGCGGDYENCDADDLTFVVPLPTSGLQAGRPGVDTQVNIYRIRDGVETQLLLNKYSFYSLVLEDPAEQTIFITGAANPYSYTIINTGVNVTGTGVAGSISEPAAPGDSGIFTSSEVNFDASDVGKQIIIKSLKRTNLNIENEAAGIGDYLFGDSTAGNVLYISEVIDDNSVYVYGEDGSSSIVEIDSNATEVQFFIKDPADSTDRAALLITRDVVESGDLATGDGLRISYIDQVDADFFDTNWFEAFEALEAEECQIVVPLPLQNRSGIFRAAVQHVETMSTIAIQKERITMFGAQQGLTPDALIGLEEVAIEDIGVIEGIQGDDPEEVLDGNTEDLVNYKLSDNFTSNRAVYFYPDQIVRPINGSNTFIDGFYMAAAAAGYLSATQNVAIPLTNKILAGFSILRNKKFRPVTLNQLGAVGATVVQPVVGGGKVLAGRTTSQSGYVEDEEISIIFIRDRVKEVVRQGLQPFIGVVEDNNTLGAITAKVIGLLSSLLTQGLITDYKNVRVERDKIDPRQWNVYLRFQPAYPINYVFIDIEVGVL